MIPHLGLSSEVMYHLIIQFPTFPHSRAHSPRHVTIGVSAMPGRDQSASVGQTVCSCVCSRHGIRYKRGEAKKAEARGWCAAGPDETDFV